MPSKRFVLLREVHAAFNYNVASFKIPASRDGTSYLMALFEASTWDIAPEAWLLALGLRRLDKVFGADSVDHTGLRQQIRREGVGLPRCYRSTRPAAWVQDALVVMPREEGYLDALADLHRCRCVNVKPLAHRLALQWLSYDWIDGPERAGLRAYLRTQGFHEELLDALVKETLERRTEHA